METDLFNYQRKNFLILMSYYKEINERAENYYCFMQNYKNYTLEYLDNISNLLNSFSKDFSKNNLDEKNNYNNVDESEFNYEIDFSPLDAITHNLYQGFKGQINGIKFFLKGIDFSLDNFIGVIKQTKLEVEKQKIKYLNLKNNFLENISSIKKENEEIVTEISDIEKRVIKFYFLSKKEKEKEAQFKNIKKDTESEIDNKILEIKEKEKNFLNKDLNKLKDFVNFNNEIEDYIKKLKNNAFLLIKILKLSIEMFSKYFNNLIKLKNDNNDKKDNKSTHTDIKNENKKEEQINYELIINKNLKAVNNNTMKSSLIQTKAICYHPIVLKMRSMTLSNEICNKFNKEGFDINLNDIIISSNDVLYIMEKLVNFSLVDKEGYDIEKEKNKIIIRDIVKNLFKIDNKNNEKMIEDESQKLFKYLEIDKDYRSHFLFVLGNHRVNSNVQLSHKLFDNLKKMFSYVSDMILKDKDYNTENNLIILSQTFFKLDNNEKIYISDLIKEHFIFQSEDFWKEYIKFQISLDAKNKIFGHSEIGEKSEINQKTLDRKYNEIIFSQIISANQSMKNYGIDQSKINNIINSLFIIYPKINPQTKTQILNFINMK